MSTLRVSNIEAKADASSPSVNEKLKVTNSNGDVKFTIDGETVGITTIGVNTTGKTFDVNANQDVSFSGHVSFASSISVDSVGIGTNNPAEHLNIFASSGNDAAIQLQTTTIAVNKARISKENTGELKITSSLGGAGRSIIFETKGSGQTERMRIKANGSVGIGTADTDRVLAVYGTGNLGTQLALESPDTNAAGLSIEGDRRYEIQSTSTVYTHPSSLIFYDRDADALRMKIDENGRVSRPYQLWIAGSPNNTTGAGIANAFNTSGFSSPVGLSFDTSNNNNRITVPIAGVYLITFTTICDTGVGRDDASILVNGSAILSTLNDTNTDGYHYRGASISVKLAASDYIQFSNEDWYAHSNANQDQVWRRASVYLLG